MKKIILIFTLWVGILNAQKTTPMEQFPKIKSTINIPIRIHLSEINRVINESVKGLIYEDNSYNNNNNDQSKVKVWKDGNIEILGGKKQNLIIKVPLKIWTKKGIGKFGVYTYQETTFKTEMFFSSKVELKNDWQISLTTIPKGFKWIQKPILDFGVVKIPVTSIVEKSLKEEQAKFCTTIDENADKELHFKKQASLAWNQFNEPILISEEYNTWLKITPLKLNVTPLIFYRNAIDFKIGLDVYSETFIGEKPTKSIAKTIENLHFVPEIKDEFSLQTTANISYEEATRLAREMFLNEEYNLKGKKVKITDIQVSGEDEKIIITATTKGALNGISTISGTPVYDEEKKKIVLANSKFKLKTKNILHKALAFVFKRKIVKKIEDEYGIPTDELESEAKKSLMKNLNKEYYKGLKTIGKVTHLKPSNVVLNNIGITIVIDVKAKLNLIIKGM